MSGLAERSKVHCHIRLNISSENNDIGFRSFKKKIHHLNAIRKQI